MTRRTPHPTDGRLCVIMSGGPLSRRVYFADDVRTLRRLEMERGRPWHYHETPRSVSIGQVHQYVQDERLSQAPATVWEWRKDPVDTAKIG